MVEKIPKRYFSVPEANRLLPLVGKILSRMAGIQSKLDTITSIEVYYEDFYEDMAYGVQYDKKFHQLSYAFFREYERLVQLGVILKSAEDGLVDFFARHEGREIFLCWQIGEPCIQHWHEIEDGYQGRRHISELANSEKVRKPVKLK